jgi:hypothetical protein
MRMFRMAGMSWRYPQSPVMITDSFRRDPREVLEELRAVSPDEHALLTEYLVLPSREDG